ncbi:unnamed protein product, partial [Rotaria socialis]
VRPNRRSLNNRLDASTGFLFAFFLLGCWVVVLCLFYIVNFISRHKVIADEQ